jgi:hypothetical protein
MKIQYTALTTENKKVTGVMDLPDKDAARAELHKMGVAIISVEEISEEEYVKFQKEQEEFKVQKGIKTYQFMATDPYGKDVEGTIDAMEDFSAYKRLREEYQFKVENLYLMTATEMEKTQAKAMLEAYEEQLKQSQATTKKGERRTAAQEEKEETEEDINREIVAEIDRVINNAKKTIESHPDFFSSQLLVEIQTTLNDLERIRTSNNIKHITELSNDLYALIANPDKAPADKTQDPEYQALVSEIHDSALVKKEFELYKKAVDVSGVKKLFGDIGKRLKDMTETKKDQEQGKKGIVVKIKASIHQFLEKNTQKKPTKLPKAKRAEKPKTMFGEVIDNLREYFKATSPILKQTRRRELLKALKKWMSRKKPEEEKAAKTPEAEFQKKVAKIAAKENKRKVAAEKRSGRDFTGFFVEVDSFVGWLLCFYIFYFYLVEFSIEKGLGLPREFVFQTLKTPLLPNVTLALLMAHFILRLRNLHFRQNTLATVFLFFMGIAAYLLVVVNF